MCGVSAIVGSFFCPYKERLSFNMHPAFSGPRRIVD